MKTTYFDTQHYKRLDSGLGYNITITEDFDVSLKLIKPRASTPFFFATIKKESVWEVIKKHNEELLTKQNNYFAATSNRLLHQEKMAYFSLGMVFLCENKAANIFKLFQITEISGSNVGVRPIAFAVDSNKCVVALLGAFSSHQIYAEPRFFENQVFLVIDGRFVAYLWDGLTREKD